MAEGLRLGRLSPEGVQFGKALHNRVLQDFLGFGAENCDSFLTASGVCDGKRVRPPLIAHHWKTSTGSTSIKAIRKRISDED